RVSVLQATLTGASRLYHTSVSRPRDVGQDLHTSEFTVQNQTCVVPTSRHGRVLAAQTSRYSSVAKAILLATLLLKPRVAEINRSRRPWTSSGSLKARSASRRSRLWTGRWRSSAAAA